jgi:glycosyltransferase involved in cell wall biosynthesis
MSKPPGTQPRVLFASCGAWHLPHTAKAFSERDALASLWISLGNHVGIPLGKYRRAWPFHAAMLPLYKFAPEIWVERAFYAFFPLWKIWLSQQQSPECNMVQAIAGYGTEPFDRAETIGALKVLDCPNSHPNSLQKLWQRECDAWCPGEKIPIPHWMFARMERELNQADVILCPSTFVRDSMIVNGLPEEKCFVNPFGVDTSIFRPRPKVPSRARFIAVGTICLRKGHQYLFRAFEQVQREIPEVELVCVGNYKADFRLERKRWEGTFTHFQGLYHPDLAKLLQTCSAFVIPSVEEGFARVISEAMSVGLPIIGTHESGSSTQITDGIEGLIVPSCNVERLAESMIRLARDVDLNRTMGIAALKRGTTSNSWQDYGDRLLNEYAKRLD